MIAEIFYELLHIKFSDLSRRKKSLSNNVIEDFPSNSLSFSNFMTKFSSYDNNLDDKIGLYIITPTYPRPEQLPELTRLSQTLMVFLNSYWYN